MKKHLKRAALVCGALVAVLVLAVGGYIGYLQLQYYRIEDGIPLEVVTPQETTLQTDTPYTAISCNLGFGAYGPEYSFFMDTGVMEDGTPTQGIYGKARSQEDVLANTTLALETLQPLDADFLLFQEVDRDSHRSYQVDQREMVSEAFPGYGYTWAENFHSGYLAYPLNDHHGAVTAGLLTLTRYSVSDAVRRSYPIDDNFFIKFTDLDRCFSVMRLSVEGTDRQLVLIHSHMSAYDSGGIIRAQQLELLCQVLEEEYAAGNYVIAGGDFNHALYGTELAFPSQQQFPGWVQSLGDSDLPEHFSFVQADNGFSVPTCRGADIPYEKGVNYTTVVDGFAVSDNVIAKAENLDTDFAFSDHNPVQLTFELAA